MSDHPLKMARRAILASGVVLPETECRGEGRCALCNCEVGRGLPISEAFPDTYFYWARHLVAGATHACAECLSVLRAEHIDFGGKVNQRLRNYSHCIEGERWVYASKANPERVREFLLADHGSPWFCAVAVSGQKHVLPWARVNAGGEDRWAHFWVRVEDNNACTCRAKLSGAFVIVERLLAHGVGVTALRESSEPPAKALEAAVRNGIADALLKDWEFVRAKQDAPDWWLITWLARRPK